MLHSPATLGISAIICSIITYTILLVSKNKMSRFFRQNEFDVDGKVRVLAGSSTELDQLLTSVTRLF